MQVIWTWVQSHWFVLWPIVTALSSIGYSLLDENTFFHSLFSALASMGIDLPKLLAMLAKLLGVGGSASGGGTVSGSKPADTPTVPPKPPVAMRLGRRRHRLVWPILLAATTVACSSCTKAQGVEVATVTVDTLVCVLNHEADPPTQIAIECGLSDVQQVLQILDAHKAAEIREAVANATATMDAGRSVVDAGAK